MCDSLNIYSIISKVRNIVKKFRNSTGKNKILQKHAEPIFKKEIVLHLDCKTRWNSLETMNSNFLKYITPITTALNELKICSNLKKIEISMLSKFNEVIIPLSQVVTLLSKSNNNIWTTEIIIRALINELREMDSPYARILKESVLMRYSSRRNKSLISILDFFQKQKLLKQSRY